MVEHRGGSLRYIFIIPIVILIVISSLGNQKAEKNFAGVISEEGTSAEEISTNDYEVPIYQIPITENTQRDILKLCEQNHLSYELVLSIYQIDGITDTQIDSIKEEIEKLADIRNYWAGQGYPDEVVFNLMLLSNKVGIDGCKILMKDHISYETDEYIQTVTDYKYYLEQSLDTKAAL